MVRQSPQLLLLLVAGIIATVTAGPTGSRSSCAFQCTNADRFSYKLGNSYIYDYTIETSTDVLGAQDGDASSISVFTRASIDVASPCELILRLNDVSMKGSSRSQEFATELTKTPLRFSFQDGKVEHICAEVNEPAWVLNFKKGIISTFQSSMTITEGNETVVETDISGICKTHYSATNSGDKVSILKTKDIKSCTERPEYGSHVGSSSYASDSPVQSLPIVNSEQLCQQQMQGGILQTSECTESHKFRPFSSEKGGAVTTTKITMALKSQERTTVAVTDFEFSRMNLLFDHSQSSAESELETVEKILSELDVESQNQISSQVPTLFATLVSVLKGFEYPQLNTIFTNAKGRRSLRFLIDAIPLVGTPAAASVVRDMILNGDMTDTEADIWFTALAFQKNPSLAMFTSLAPLMENGPSQKAMLGVSALLNNYCKKNVACGNEAEVQLILRYLETNLGSACRTFNDEEKVKIMVALKAIGNVGRFVNVESILRRCYTEEQNDIEVRIAAIQAWRHTPCEYDRTHLLGAFQDENQDTEIRIAAYLALMTCPNPTLINNLKDRLTSEGVNQVGSFIWSHMVNLQESAAPGKQWVRELIGEELLQKKFSTEALKYSRNYESSIFTKELNAGASVESNVIFSRKSFLPRSAMLNLTLDLFGESINLFEIGGRIEGFEMFIERFFGPDGYYPEETVEAIIKNMRQKKTDGEATSIESFLDKVTDEPEGSYYLRVFGNEMHYKNFHGLENLMESTSFSNPLEFLMELARKGNVDYSKSYKLIDTQYTLPTISGFPVILKVNSTASLALKMNGNFNVRSMKNINIEGRFQPSAAIVMDTSMSVDAYVNKAGMKMVSSLRTSTFLEGKIQINGGKLVDVAINTPKDKVEIINVNVEYFRMEGDQLIPSKDLPVQKYNECTCGSTGLSLCGELSYSLSNASPSYFLSGPRSASVYLKKTDSQNGYVLKFSRDATQVMLLVDTPGSTVNHKMLLTLTKTETGAEFNLDIPNKTIQGNALYKLQQKNKNVKIEFTIDGGSPYIVDTGLKISGTDSQMFEPKLIVTSPEGEIVALNGNIQYKKEDNFISTMAELEYKFFDNNKQSISYIGKIKKENPEDMKTISVNVKLNPSEFPALALDLDWKSQMSADYLHNTATLVRGPVSWSAEQLLSYTNTNGRYGHNIQLEVKCPYRKIDFLISNEAKVTPNMINLKAKMKLSPAREYNVAFLFDKQDTANIEWRIDTQSPNHSAALEFSIKTVEEGHYRAQVNGNVNGKAMEVKASIQNLSSPGKSHHIIDASCKCSGDMEIHAAFTADSQHASADLSFNVDDNKYYVKAEGTTTSITFDANVFKHIVLSAKVDPTGIKKTIEVNAEWDKEDDPTKAFTIKGEISPEAVNAKYKYGDVEMIFEGQLVMNGVTMKTTWAPGKIISANIQYSLEEEKSVSITAETPFPGWEKQDASFTFNINNENEVQSRFASTWKNLDHMTLVFTSKIQPGFFTNKLDTEILLTSTITDFERLSFSLNHDMDDATIMTSLEGKWNEKLMKGNFNYKCEENTFTVGSVFISPFTQDLTLTVHHQYFKKDLSTILSTTYGSDTTTMSLKGHLDLGLIHDVTLVFKVVSPNAFVSNISANVSYKVVASKIQFLTEGRVGDNKMMLSLNGEAVTEGDSKSITGDVRFITPFTYPLTVTLSHKQTDQQFTSDFEITRIWSSYGSVKVHMEGNIPSKDKFELSAHLTSPIVRATATVNHKILENKINSNLEVNVNEEKISFTVNGILDETSKLASMEAHMTSTYDGLDDIKLSLEHFKADNTYTTDIIISKGTYSFKFHHVLNFNDIKNWENKLTVNNKYKLNIKMNVDETSCLHEIEYAWDINNQIYGILTTNKEPKADANIFKAVGKLKTPWTKDIQFELNRACSDSETKSDITIEYQPGTKLIITYVLNNQTALLYLKSTLVTPSWQPLGMEGTFNINSWFADITLTRGVNNTNIKITGKKESGKLDASVVIDSTYITMPFTVEVGYDIQLDEKSAHITVLNDRKYEVRGNLVGLGTDAKFQVSLDLPMEGYQHVELTGEYQVANMPLTAKASFTKDNDKYSIGTKLDKKSFNIIINANDQSGGIVSAWKYNPTKSSIEIKFNSPVKTIEDMNMVFSYNFEDMKTIHATLSRGDKDLTLTGKFENGRVLLEGTTPFSGWEVIKASGFVSSSAVTAYVSRNDRKIEVTGTLHIKPGKGSINLTVTTPYEGYDTISFDTKYTMQGSVKKIEFNSKFGEIEISVNGVADLSDAFNPDLMCDIFTPFTIVKKIGGHAKWNFKTATKMAEVKFYLNEDEYTWQLQVSAESLYKGQATSKITTSIDGLKDITIEGKFDFQNSPYQASLIFESESVIKTLSGSVNIDRSTISGEFQTPISGYEKIVMNGNYNFAENHLTANAAASIGTQKYELKGDIFFNNQKPKFNITLKTPLNDATNIKISFEANTVDLEKSALLKVITDSVVYLISAKGKKISKEGFIQIITLAPIPGYTSLQFNGKYDFTGDIKTAEIEYSKENVKQHFSLQAKVNNNNFFVDINTPFDEFQTLNVRGDYTSVSDQHNIIATLEINNNKYGFDSMVHTFDKLFTMAISSPITGYKTMSAYGKIVGNRIELDLTKEQIEYKFAAVYEFDTTNASLKMWTPMPEMKYVSVGGSYVVSESELEASTFLEHNDKKFEIITKWSFLPKKSYFNIFAKTPISGYNTLKLNIQYDLISEIKIAEISVQKEEITKKINLQTSYNLNEGSFYIETSFNGFERFGAEYNLNIDRDNKAMNAALIIKINEKEWIYSAKGHFAQDHIKIKFMSPIENYETVSINGKINFDQESAELSIQFGPNSFKSQVSYAKDNMYLKLTSTCEMLKIFSITTKYIWVANQKEGKIIFNYNEQTYDLIGTLFLSAHSSQLHLQANTPFKDFTTISIKANYDLNNTDQLLNCSLILNQDVFALTVGGFLKDKTALFTWKLTSPIVGWTQAKFIARIDLTSEDKVLDISLENEGDKKVISISGKVIGGLVDIKLKSPFSGFENFKMFGSLDRSKRSIEFNMMNDEASGGVIASFNSVKLHVKTPYEEAREISWEVSLSNKGEVKIEWKRNENYAILEAIPQGKKKSVDITIKSEFPGWEFLALSGRLDQDEIQGYLSGTINEQKTTVEGKGSFDARDGSMNIKVETPYEQYRTVDINIDYNFKKKAAKIEAKSNSSEFHFIAEFKGKYSLRLFVPNNNKNTVVSINLAPSVGNINIDSRFPSIQNFKFEYKIAIDSVITATQTTELNGIKLFELQFESDRKNNKANLEIHARRGENHSMLHLNRDGWNLISVVFERNGKELKFEAKGSGELPEYGYYDIVTNNTFREIPRSITARVDIDRRSSPKTLKVEVELESGDLYVIDAKYNAVIGSGVGDFDITITTPEKKFSPWKSVTGSWDIRDREDAKLELTVGGNKYTANGKFGLRESNLTLTSLKAGNIFLQWRFYREGNTRDYFLKAGPEERYLMFKLKGTIEDIANADLEAGFKGPTLMKDEFLLNAKWNKGSGGSVTGSGTFNYGKYSGTHELKNFKRDAATRSAEFSWEATSNIPHYSRATLSGQYDFNNKVLIKAKLAWDVDEIALNVNFEDLNSRFSNNTAFLHTPRLGNVDITLSHDFRNPLDKTINAIAKFGDNESSVKAHWSRSENFNTLSGNIHIESRFLGSIDIKGEYDINNLNDAHCEIYYTRNNDKNLSFKWVRKLTDKDFHAQINFTSHFKIVPNFKIYADIEFENGLKLSAGAEGPTKKLAFTLNVDGNSILSHLTTPLEGFEDISSNINYNLEGKNKSIVFTYSRGERKVNLNFELNVKNKKEGEVKLTLTTPFEVLRNFEIDGSWKNKKGNINYKRNDVNYMFDGKIEYQGDQSSVDISFQPDGKLPIRIAAAYNFKNILAGKGTNTEELASLIIELEGHNLNFNLNGFRNSDRILIETNGGSSFMTIKNFHVKLDSELNLQSRDGSFILTLNDFLFKMHNHFERRQNNGYYFKTEIESTLTPLPGLTIGIGREEDKRIVTVGYGDEREITISFQPKDSFKKGFSGTISVPHRGYNELQYDIDYSFKGEDKLQVKISIDLNDGKTIDVDFVYDSDGVKARLSSPFTGDHHARVRRSISQDEFLAEAGFDDYNIKLRGGFKNEDTKRGFVIEGEIFGKKILIDTFLQFEGREYIEGRLIILTPIQGFEKLGGIFKISNINKKVNAQVEMTLPSYTMPKIMGEINMDFNNKINGFITIILADMEFSLKTNLLGTLNNGFNGNLVIISPFHAFSLVEVDGSFKINSLNFITTDLKIKAPFATHEIMINHKIDTNSIQTKVEIESSRLVNKYVTTFNYDTTGHNGKKVQIQINDCKLVADMMYDQSSIKINVDTIIMAIHRQLSIHAKYPSVNSMEGEFIIVLDGQSHKINGEFSVLDDRVHTGIELDSDFMEGIRKVTFEGTIPKSSSENLSYNVILITHETHSLTFDITRNAELKVRFGVESPLFPKINAIINFNGVTAGITVETPKGIHKAQVSWRATRKMPADLSASLELSSPLLEVDYIISASLSGSRIKKQVLMEIMAGEVKHGFEGRILTKENGGELAVMLDTPYKNIDKATFKSILTFENKIKASIVANYANIKNSFKAEIDKFSRTFKLEGVSPLIPAGSFNMDMALTGDTVQDLTIKMSLSHADMTISSTLSLKIKSPENIATDLQIITPFKGYRKMNFGASYLNQDGIKISIFSDKLMKFKAEAMFNNTSEEFNSTFKIETPITKFDKIEGELKIPLNKLQPKMFLTLPGHKYGVSAEYENTAYSHKLGCNLALDSDTYGAQVGLRNRGPYELSYNLHAPSLDKSFHLRTDSSFISAFA